MSLSILLKILGNKYFLIGVLVLVVVFLTYKNSVLNNDNKRNEYNYGLLLESSAEAIKISDNQLKQAIESDKLARALLRDSLKLKNKEIQKLVKSRSETIYEFKTFLTDSIVYNIIDSTLIYAKTLSYQDDYSNVSGYVMNDSISLNIKSYDTLYVITSFFKTGNWFLPRLFEKKKTKVQIKGGNPNSNYEVVRVFEKI